MSTTTLHPKTNTVSRTWHLIDAKDQVLGRLASAISQKIMGKGKTTYSPHVDCGDFVVVVNAEHIRITGNNKPDQKIDFRHSGYPGGHTYTPYRQFLEENPERAIWLAVNGMVPKNRLRRRVMTRLRVFKGAENPHAAQFNAGKGKRAQKSEENTKDEGK